MLIQQLTLFTSCLPSIKDFYVNTLGFEIIRDEMDHFSIMVGSSELQFVRAELDHVYHYCFLIPSNKLNEAIQWLSERTDLIEIEPDRVVQRFESWNADSIYFYDGGGNVAEFIVRYDLENDSEEDFSASSIINVNEIGLPTNNIKKTNETLSTTLNTASWKGNMEVFGTNGDQNGLFLLPNYEAKSHWFPTELAIEREPFEAVVEVKGICHRITNTAHEVKVEKL